MEILYLGDEVVGELEGAEHGRVEESLKTGYVVEVEFEGEEVGEEA